MQKNIRKFVSISLTAAALAVSTLASAATDLTGKSWSEIEDLAKKEGKVTISVWYLQPQFRNFVKAFESQYGIKVKVPEGTLDGNINNPFIGIVIGHVVLTLPYAIRILSAGFSSVPQDLIDASRDLGASKFTVFKDVYMPMLKPSFLASIIFCLVKSIEEFAIAFVIGSPDFITVPTILYSFLGYSFIRPNAAVVSIILLVPNIILMMIIEKLLKGNYLSQSTGKA